MNELENLSHRRYNILTGKWVLVSPHRTKRPWQGQVEKNILKQRPTYDPKCYLCPTNGRANGKSNPNYNDVFVFINDFAALQSNSLNSTVKNGLLKADKESGVCKVVCFSPDHSKSLADMNIDSITKVVKMWKLEYNLLIQTPGINYVQIFENKGAIMGCSNPHPHGQIWGQYSIPNEVQEKDLNQYKYFQKNERSLLMDYISQELELKDRIIFENKHFVVLVPFWAIWPFETMIVPKQQQAHIGHLNTNQEIAFAQTLKKLTSTYDKLFECSFPYSSGIHQSYKDQQYHWHWHMSFYPPLLRSSTVKKFMVGYEMFAMPQRDITAEQAAERLRGLI